MYYLQYWLCISINVYEGIKVLFDTTIPNVNEGTYCHSTRCRVQSFNRNQTKAMLNIVLHI